MAFKVFIMLVIFKMASSLPDSSVNVNVNVNDAKDKDYIDVNTKCGDIHGKCVAKSMNCPAGLIGTAGPSCPDPFYRCCYPRMPICPKVCLATKYCFFYYPSSQCFCSVKSTKLNHTRAEAMGECNTHGMLLPHPNDALGLRNVAVEHCGNCGPLWTNAMYDIGQSDMVWQDTWTWSGDKVVITVLDPLINTPPTSFAPDDCLEMSASYATKNDGKPYSVKKCTDAITNQDNILCSKVW